MGRDKFKRSLFNLMAPMFHVRRQWWEAIGIRNVDLKLYRETSERFLKLDIFFKLKSFITRSSANISVYEPK